MPLRPISDVVNAHRQKEGGGFIVRRPFPTIGADHFDPFLLLDEMGPVEYGPGEAVGAPDHPHRGFETVTYLLEGSMEHRDSTGAVGVIRPGAVQWMTAGRGVVHSEMPTKDLLEKGGRSHGFQIWVNLKKQAKLCPPKYQGFEAHEFNVVDLGGGGKCRVLAGEILGAKGPVETTSPVTYAHATLKKGQSIYWEVEDGHTALVYIFKGSSNVNCNKIDDGQLMVFGRSTGGVDIRALDESDMLLLGGQPLNEPVARRGPFVMNTDEEIMQAFKDYRDGKLGSIPAQGSGVVRS